MIGSALLSALEPLGTCVRVVGNCPRHSPQVHPAVRAWLCHLGILCNTEWANTKAGLCESLAAVPLVVTASQALDDVCEELLAAGQELLQADLPASCLGGK